MWEKWLKYTTDSVSEMAHGPDTFEFDGVMVKAHNYEGMKLITKQRR